MTLSTKRLIATLSLVTALVVTSTTAIAADRIGIRASDLSIVIHDSHRSDRNYYKQQYTNRYDNSYRQKRYRQSKRSYRQNKRRYNNDYYYNNGRSYDYKYNHNYRSNSYRSNEYRGNDYLSNRRRGSRY